MSATHLSSERFFPAEKIGGVSQEGNVSILGGESGQVFFMPMQSRLLGRVIFHETVHDGSGSARSSSAIVTLGLLTLEQAGIGQKSC